jgi:hypothetical protein
MTKQFKLFVATAVFLIASVPYIKSFPLETRQALAVPAAWRIPGQWTTARDGKWCHVTDYGCGASPTDIFEKSGTYIIWTDAGGYPLILKVRTSDNLQYDLQSEWHRNERRPYKKDVYVTWREGDTPNQDISRFQRQILNAVY